MKGIKVKIVIFFLNKLLIYQKTSTHIIYLIVFLIKNNLQCLIFYK